MSAQKSVEALYEKYKGRKASLRGTKGIVVGYASAAEDLEEEGGPLIMGIERGMGEENGWSEIVLDPRDIIEEGCPFAYFLYINPSDIEDGNDCL